MRSLNNTRSNKTVFVPVVLSFLFAFCCMIIPIQPTYKWLRPDLVTLLVIYWVATSPQHFGVVFAFFIGLLFDLLSGMLFGSMGLTLGIIAFLTTSFRLRLRIYRPWQKFIIIMLLVACSQLIRLWIQMIIGHPPATFLYWLSSIISALTWPLINGILTSFKRSLRLAT
ncbi:MAG TPA: rod shape-determining protein MreD [Gammaproteobacteria bacterium]|nr:rod shape-determining protein MreD [Gammaproteobacteria bacterium]